MRTNALICAAVLTLVGCETFRSLDSVEQPSAAGDVATDAGDAGATDAADMGSDPTDTATPDMSVPDSSDPADLVDTDAEVDSGPDMNGPRTCPATSPAAPAWAAATGFAPSIVVIDDDDTVEDHVSLAASAHDAGPAQFVAAYRRQDGVSLLGRVATIETSGSFDYFGVGVAGATTVRDIAVARAPAGSGDDFVMFAIGQDDACAGSGVLAMSDGLVGRGAAFRQQGQVELIFEACDLFTSPVALTGPDGVSPNLRLTTTSSVSADVNVYPTAGQTPVATITGNQFVSRISASTRDAVATPGNGTAWNIWRPAVADVPTNIDLQGGPLEIEYLYDDCHAVASARGVDVVLAPVECTTQCDVGSSSSFAAAGNARLADISPMPGGGFVVAVAVGDASQHLDVMFFDDAFQRLTVDGATVHELAPDGSTIGDLSVVATTDGGNIVIGALYSRMGPVDRSVEFALLTFDEVTF